ncbi:MAG: ribonuclease HII [Minisyncoccia bacterium]
MKRWIMGIDEVGRGPLAGPVAVGLVMVRSGFNIAKHFPDIADSKTLSEKKREEIYKLLLARKKTGDVLFCVRFSGNTYIDEYGITRAVRRSIYKGVRLLAPKPQGVRIVLDGLLHAPEEYRQETIVRGDVIEPIISLASIAAKVERDRLMKKLAKKYPGYGFEEHKGYGTRKHFKAIAHLGLSRIHRRSFCKNKGGMV